MSSKQQQIANKLLILNKIRDAKEILFGAFSSLTKEDKVREWRNIHNIALSVGLIPDAKDFTYVRDVLWQNLKKTTVAKLDNAKKTGSAGGKISKLTDIDNIVIDIIGKESPIVTSLGVNETWEKPLEETTACENNAEATPVVVGDETPCSSKGQKRKKISSESSLHHTDYQEIQRRKKIALQNELLEIQIYKSKLEALKLERDLGLPMSHYTKDITKCDDNEEEGVYYLLTNGVAEEANE
ncbi:uncharacterized protein [Anabrus simplex]|uniref:uncharacterized protein n=1 Tax=Anabrus simplex TaxID=316456 RepID=UPI0035A2B7AC